MSKLVALFETDDAAFCALAGIEDEASGSGQVLPDVADPAEAVATELLLSGREAARTGVGALAGGALALLLLYLHRLGVVTFPLLSPAFAGGIMPAYLAATLVGSSAGAFIFGLIALTQPYRVIGPEPSVLVIYCPRRELPRVRAVVSQFGGQLT